MSWTRGDQVAHYAAAIVIAENTAAGEPTSEWILEEFRDLHTRWCSDLCPEHQTKGTATHSPKSRRGPLNQ